MPGRSYNSDEYRYGFNGMEKDDEVSGQGNSYSTFWRQYDPRIARWKSIDPEASSFPHQSPYVSMDNSPISLSDPFGNCPNCPKDGMEGDVHTTTDTYPGNAPNGDAVSGTDGNGWIFNSTDVSSMSWINTGDTWVIGGFTTEGGTSYAWDQEKSWYTDVDGNEFDDHLTMDITNSVKGSVAPSVQIFMDAMNGDALKSFKDAYHAHGGSPAEFVFDGFKQMASDLTAGGHKGAMAWGTLLTGYQMSGGVFYTQALGNGLTTGVLNSSIPIYRVYGGQAGRFGASWTFVNPQLYGRYYRNFAGLPNVNSGNLMIKGSIQIREINSFRMALPLDGNIGRLTPELLINNSWSKIKWSPSSVRQVNF